MVLQVIPYLLLFFWVTPNSSGSSPSFVGRDGHVVRAAKKPCAMQGVLNRVFLGLALDKFPYLWHVFRGHLGVVGHQMISTEASVRTRLDILPRYSPGVFSYSEMNGCDRDQDEIEMDELYYSHHATLWLDLRIFIRSLIVRLNRTMS